MTLKIPLSTVLVFCLLLPAVVFAQSGSALPVATTIELPVSAIEEGQAVVYLEESNSYDLSNEPNDGRFYGVTAERPALVFSTASGTVPVVTFGVAALQVNIQNGPIARGDVLVTSWEQGIAMKGDGELQNAFAIALEPFDGAGGETGVILVEIDPQKAKDLQAARVLQQEEGGLSEAEAEEDRFPFVRAAIASVIAIGALFFILYSFRSVIAKGVVSVGRNPRASTSIVTFAFGNLLFALILCAIALFVAIAVLVLPLP